MTTKPRTAREILADVWRDGYKGRRTTKEVLDQALSELRSLILAKKIPLHNNEKCRREGHFVEWWGCEHDMEHEIRNKCIEEIAEELR